MAASDIGIRLTASDQTGGAFNSVKAGLGTLKDGAETVKSALAGMAAGLGVVSFATKLVDVQRQFDVLNSSLITVTGSSARAAQEMDWIRQFAATTPFQLAQVTDAFVRMKSLGLDASVKSLTSYGNTASAMGKSLNQMVEAVADAATGEFERLKEFGIKASKEGDKVALTFQGVTTTVANSAAEITKYLQGIGDVQFGGAMATRAQTLDGAISNLADSWDALFLTVSQNNAGSLIYESVKAAAGSLADATTIINAMSSAAEANAQSVSLMTAAMTGLATVMETVAVLGVNVKYVLVQTGREIGGWIAQLNALGEGGGVFSAEGRAAWTAVGDAMKADAQAARAEVDATTDRILGARRAAQDLAQWNTRNASAATDPRRLDAATQATSANTAATAANAKAAKEAAKAREELTKAATRSAQALADARNKEYDDVTAYMRAESNRLADTARASEAAVIAAQEEYDNHGKLRSEIAQTTLARLQDQLVSKTAGTEAYESLQRQISAQKQLIAIMQNTEARAVAEDGLADARALAEANRKAADESGKYWEDALMRAFESGKGFFESLWSTIKNTMKTQILRVSVQAVMGTLGLGAASAAGAADGTLGLTSAVSALTNLPSAVSGLAASASAFWAGATASGATAAGAASAGLAYSGATAAGTGAAFSTGAGLSTALAAVPVWGWVAMAALALFGMNKKTPSAGTGEGNAMFDAAGNVTDASSRYTGGWGLTDQVGTTLADLQASYAGAARALGIATVATEFAFGGNTGKEGKDPQFALGVNAGGVSYSSGELKLTDANVQLAASRAVFAALQGSELPAYLVGAFDGLLPASATQEQITSALNQASAVKTFHDAVQDLPFDGLKNLSFDASIALGQASGGLDVLVASLTDMQAASASARAGIAALVDGIDARVSEAIFGMQYGMEDNAGKFNMLDVRAANLNDQMLASTDLAAVAKLAEQQIATINQAWGLLSAEQQRAQYLEFESRLNKVDDLVTARGADALSLQQAAEDRAAQTIADAVEAAVAKALANPAAAMQAAADKADKPIEVVSTVNVNVTAPAGSEVSISQ